MGTFELVVLVIIGLFAGVCGGMLGVGGSIVMIPVMTEVLGPNQHLYQATAMIVNFFVAVPAAWQHRQAETGNAKIVVRMIPMAIIAVIVGVGLSELSCFSGEGEDRLRQLFGLFLLLIVGIDLYRVLGRKARRQEGTEAQKGGGTEGRLFAPSLLPKWPLIALVAIPTGLVAGLLGVGGGILAVPLQRRVLGVPIRAAIANSATLIIATSFIGAMVKNYALIRHGGGLHAPEHGYTWHSFALAAVLIPMAILGSIIGSRMTHRLPLRLVKGAFSLLLAAAAIRLIATS